MVKIGFIVEGNSDVIMLKECKGITNVFESYNIDASTDLIINARGKSNLKTKFVSYYKDLMNKGVDYVFVMVDQDDKEAQRKNRKYKPIDCPLTVVQEIQSYRDNKNYINKNQVYVIMTREMEAWFLADNNLGFNCNGKNPEEILNPADEVGKQLGAMAHIQIANRMKNRFSLERAAQNAPSARRFINKLKEISGNNE